MATAVVTKIPSTTIKKSKISPPISFTKQAFLSFHFNTLTERRKKHISKFSPIISHKTTTISLLEFGLNEAETEALLTKNPSVHTETPQSLHDISTSLQSLGITGSALSRTVARHPQILTSAEIHHFIAFVRENLLGLEPHKLERLLVSTHPSLLPSFPEKVRTLVRFGVPNEKLVQVLNNVNLGTFCLKSVEDVERVMSFLDRFGGPELVIRRPALLNLDLESQLEPRTEYLTALAGGDEKGTEALLRKLPSVLAYTVEHYESHVEFWRSYVGLRDDKIFKMLLVYPNIFSASRERKLAPRIEFLRECGLGSDDIFKFFLKSPLFLSLSFKKNLSKKLSFLVKIGYEHRTREMAFAFGASTRTSCENMQRVIGMFFEFGFTGEDLFAMSKRHPQVLQYNYESLEEKMEYLIEEMGRDIGELLAFPAFLGYRLDDRIKKRYELKKETRGKDMSLNKLLSVSSKHFYSKKLKNSREIKKK
ncbi:hypothetical protein QJS04_geneDACA021833 [Acorus gramineus]|uniref:Uncharacterized protein n=1 Tax=Acorus gramineus TaxID=55184 RepID=A0AAV9ADW2_ACOGR|nr:hypothetical protein QJS04_geneDACA021833 [Acorus gramineus]